MVGVERCDAMRRCGEGGVRLRQAQRVQGGCCCRQGRWHEGGDGGGAAGVRATAAQQPD